MVHPEVAMSFSHNDTSLFNLIKSTYRQRIVGIMGSKVNEKLVPVEEVTDLISIKGYVGKPEFARKTRGLQYFFVNNRFIKHSYLNHAVLSAFEGLLKDKSNPAYFLYLTVPTDSVDINIHPTKTEVKFDDEHSLYAILRASVKHALGQFSVNAIDFHQEKEYEVPYDIAKNSHFKTPKIEVNPDFNPFTQDNHQKAITPSSRFQKPAAAPWESLYVGIEETSQLTDETYTDATATFMFQNHEIEQRNIFQLYRKFVISTLKSGLLVVNQQRAHERILYERLLRQLTIQNGVSQQLLFPIKINLPVDEVAILINVKQELEHTGFLFRSLQDNIVEIEGLPLELKEKDVPAVLEAIIEKEQQDLPENTYSLVDRLAQTMANTMSIKTGETLTREMMENLMDELFACKESEITASGKKIFINLTVDSLNSKFN
jgi:DNA mismatch repair protein MutL